MQPQEEIGEGVELRPVEGREEVGAAREDRGGDVVEDVDEHDRHRDERAEDDDLLGEELVDATEELVEREHDEEDQHLVHELARDAEPQEPRVRPQVLRRRRRVAGDDDLPRHVDNPIGAVRKTPRYQSPAIRACRLVSFTSAPLARLVAPSRTPSRKTSAGAARWSDLPPTAPSYAGFGPRSRFLASVHKICSYERI